MPRVYRDHSDVSIVTPKRFVEPARRPASSAAFPRPENTAVLRRPRNWWRVLYLTLRTAGTVVTCSALGYGLLSYARVLNDAAETYVAVSGGEYAAKVAEKAAGDLVMLSFPLMLASIICGIYLVGRSMDAWQELRRRASL